MSPDQTLLTGTGSSVSRTASWLTEETVRVVRVDLLQTWTCHVHTPCMCAVSKEYELTLTTRVAYGGRMIEDIILYGTLTTRDNGTFLLSQDRLTPYRCTWLRLETSQKHLISWSWPGGAEIAGKRSRVPLSFGVRNPWQTKTIKGVKLSTGTQLLLQVHKPVTEKWF